MSASLELMELAGAFTMRGVIAPNASADSAESTMRAMLDPARQFWVLAGRSDAVRGGGAAAHGALAGAVGLASSAVVTKQMSLASRHHEPRTTPLRSERLCMQLQLVRATAEPRQLDDIVRAFTPPMRRVCRHMADAALREMIERMALRELTLPRPRRTQRVAAMTPGTSSSSSRAR